ncbi:hypothetical protein JCM10212_001638 [Sporobolomyces blumeae]
MEVDDSEASAERFDIVPSPPSPSHSSTPMPNNRVKTGKALQSKKGKVNGKQIHPNSRRAKQLQRVELRTKKLELQSRVRRSNEIERVDRHLYFVHALPEDATSLPLSELHHLVQDYINRNESELVDLAHERSQRQWRKGEGKSKRETELEKLKESETGEYKSGFIVPDLTVAENVVMCRQWIRPAPSKETKNAKGGDPSFLGRIRLVRIFADDPNLVKVERGGARGDAWETGQGEVEMGDMDEVGDDDDDEDDEDDAQES